MASFGAEFERAFDGSGVVRDYQHASRTFRSNSFDLLPKRKHQFHVVFGLNLGEIPSLGSIFGGETPETLSLMVKTIQMPSFEIETEVLNQYNRKRIIQNKVSYNPINISMYDDGGDMVRKLWYNYYTYYFRDATYNHGGVQAEPSQGGDANRSAGFSYGARDIYSDSRINNDWGYNGDGFNDGFSNNPAGKPRFFNDIKIYTVKHDGSFAEMCLINPVISSWSHDQGDYTNTDPMEHTFQIQYETVKYNTGRFDRRSGAPIRGFIGSPHYDSTPSALLPELLGIDVVNGIRNIEEAVEDLQSGSVTGIINGVSKGITGFEQIRNNPSVNEALTSIGLGKDISAQTKNPQQAINANNGFAFPVPSGRATPPITGQQAREYANLYDAFGGTGPDTVTNQGGLVVDINAGGQDPADIIWT